MHGKLVLEGRYELFETSKGHQILALNEKDFYAVVEGQRGDLLIKSDAEHQQSKAPRRGRFYLADFDDDPEFNDTPHLFLKVGKASFEQWILPRGLPSNRDHQKKLVRSKDKVAAKIVEYHVHGSGDQGREVHYRGTDRQASSTAEAAGASAHQSQPPAHSKGLSSKSKKELSSKSKAELYQLAQQRQLRGRSRMDKAALIAHLSGAQSH